MKRQPTEWEKIFANEIEPRRGLWEPPIYSWSVRSTGAAPSHSETICFSEARHFLMQTHQKAHGLQVWLHFG